MSATARCVTTVAQVREELERERSRGATVGLVPTMGALHEGHLSLIRKACSDNDLAVVSVFVNPTQFGEGSDLAEYPRDLEGDRRAAEAVGADLVFSPEVAEVYATDHSTWVDVEGLTSGLCGRTRIGHFRGVCTVVSKLFNIVRPDRAYFGEKDAQQLAVIRRMVRDLNIPVDVVACPTVRETDGLAMSSRNLRLTKEQRAQASVLYRSLREAQRAVEVGEREAGALEEMIRATLAEAPLGIVEYVEIVDADSLTPVEVLAGRCLLALAVSFGEIRLIDNLAVEV